MNRFVLFGLLLLNAIVSVAQDPAGHAQGEPDTAVLSEVLVTGEQPGPGLWRASKTDESGERVLWILGAYAPLPEKMIWKSKQVENYIAESRRVVFWPRWDIDYDVGFFATLGALPLLFSADKNPNGEKLVDLLSPQVYDEWLRLKAKYGVDSRRIEEERPTFASQELRRLALAKEGLSPRAAVSSTVERVAKRHRVKVVKPEIEFEVKIDKPRSILKNFKKADLADLACFEKSLARLESDIEALKLRANAWSRGDLEQLRATSIPLDDECTQSLTNAVLLGQLADEVGARETVERLKRELATLPAKQKDAWLQAVDEATKSPGSVLLVIPIDRLFDANGGPIAWLRDRGYTITDP